MRTRIGDKELETLNEAWAVWGKKDAAISERVLAMLLAFEAIQSRQAREVLDRNSSEAMAKGARSS